MSLCAYVYGSKPVGVEPCAHTESGSIASPLLRALIGRSRKRLSVARLVNLSMREFREIGYQRSGQAQTATRGFADGCAHCVRPDIAACGRDAGFEEVSFPLPLGELAFRYGATANPCEQGGGVGVIRTAGASRHEGDPAR